MIDFTQEIQKISNRIATLIKEEKNQKEAKKEALFIILKTLKIIEENMPDWEVRISGNAGGIRWN